MLTGVSLGPGDPELITLKALRVIREADEVIVPGENAGKIVRAYREPKVVEFPMGRGHEVAKRLAEEIADRCRREKIAFCCLGDAALYSTFSILAEEVLKIAPDVEVEIIPGVSVVFSALALTKTFVKKSLLITVDFEPEVVAVLKAKNSKEIAGKLREMGYEDLKFIERLHMDGQRVSDEIPNEASYFSLILGVKR
ncbi:MAG: precorrin-2/cobalt-factor-2 C20-methyltransferase [Archaeoglobaceae archaeon]|nr:precorrin-2/cobalt-factor-2 C20-methyltransferase [Archaeoglobaceae archaeon]MDK2876404.1 precorrin-2/cobalt-factor-2 C20-methyltransferase [Archaeoglobaceae archaeon]